MAEVLNFVAAIDAAVHHGRDRRCMKIAAPRADFDQSGAVRSVGRNAPALGRCDGSDECRSSCPKICEHAEAAALRALGRGAGRTPSRFKLELVHVKLIDGDLVAGGPPSCWQCSKAILADGRVGHVWLFRAYDNGSWWKRYPVEEFHEITLDNCGLHIGADHG